MSKEIKTKAEYDDLFKVKETPAESTGKNPENLRLEKILDIRKFEIELYWKRAAYFWTFIAAAFTAYGLTITAKDVNQVNLLNFQFLIICLGLVFSFAWFLVNKASKYWQENWEKHLDLTEDDVIGPLYKTTINKGTYSSFWYPTKAYAASVSKINQILSLFVFFIWIGLLLSFFKARLILFPECISYYYTYLGILTIAILAYLLIGTRSSNGNTIVHFEKRENVDK